MSKYINVDRLKEFIKQNGFVYANTLDSFATEDVAPVIHGRWEPVIDLYKPILSEPYSMINGYKCTICGRFAEKEEPYCHCGAKMKLED